MGWSLQGEGEPSLSERGVATHSDKDQAMLSARSMHLRKQQVHCLTRALCHAPVHPGTTLPKGQGRMELSLSKRQPGEGALTRPQLSQPAC